MEPLVTLTETFLLAFVQDRTILVTRSASPPSCKKASYALKIIVLVGPTLAMLYRM